MSVTTAVLSFCIPFYRNSGMLAHQYATWASYPEPLKAQIEIVLVDDGSPEPAHDVRRPDGLPPLRIFRVLTDIPWHQHGARNLAAKEARGPWLFLTDMDHVLPSGSLHALLGILASAKPDAVHTFARLDAPRLTPTLDKNGAPKPHCNTFAMTKAHYWSIGGYDEDAVGYGTDGYFRKRLYRTQQAVHVKDIPIIRYPREVIADANTRPDVPMDPAEFRNRGRRRLETSQRMAFKASQKIPPTVLNFPWERVL